MKTDKLPRFPYKRLVLGILLMVGGCLLLLMTLGLLHSLRHIWPLPLLLAGLAFLYRCLNGGIKGFYLVGGLFLSLISIFFLLVNMVFPPGSLQKIWPVLMFIIGISILPFGIHNKKSQRTKLALIIPALVIIGLSLLFLPFSMGIIRESFTDFALKWWPLLVIFSGLILTITYFSHNLAEKSHSSVSKKTN